MKIYRVLKKAFWNLIDRYIEITDAIANMWSSSRHPMASNEKGEIKKTKTMFDDNGQDDRFLD